MRRSRTVLRILIACIISFLALLCAVSMDFKSSLTRWRSTRAALTELTSCRTNVTLTLVTELQTLRNLSVSAENGLDDDGRDEFLSSWSITMLTVSRRCAETDVDGLGQPCGVDLPEFCQRLRSDLSELVNVTQRDGLADARGATVFTLAIQKILRLWGVKEIDMGFLKLNPDWTDVLALKLLVTLQELNSRSTTGEKEIRDEIRHTTTLVSVVKEMSENLQHCWTENMATNGKGFFFSDGSVELTLRCFHAWAGWALKLKSRDVSSTISLQICLLAIACLIYPIVLLSFKQMTDWIQDYARSLREKTEDLKRERRLAEDLLHQMLPKSVAKQLRQNKHVEAESYEKVRE